MKTPFKCPECGYTNYSTKEDTDERKSGIGLIIEKPFNCGTNLPPTPYIKITDPPPKRIISEDCDIKDFCNGLLEAVFITYFPITLLFSIIGIFSLMGYLLTTIN